MRTFVLSLLCCLALVSHAQATPPELDWLELMPPEDRQALEEMPEIDHSTPEDAGFSDQGGLKQDAGLPAVMYSAKTVAELNGREIRLGGYPVPLESDARGRSTELFLVQIGRASCRERVCQYV